MAIPKCEKRSIVKKCKCWPYIIFETNKSTNHCLNVLCTKLRQKFTFWGIFIAHRRFLCSKHRLFSITSWFSQDLRHSILSLYSSQNWLLLYEQKDWVLNEQLSYFPSIEENFSNQKQSLFNHKWNFILIKVFKMFFLLIWSRFATIYSNMKNIY